MPQARHERVAVASATPGARREIRRMCAGEGPVAFLVGSPVAGEPLVCFGLRDYTPGPHEFPVGHVEGCPVYLDNRFRGRTPRFAVVLDVRGPEARAALTVRCIPL